MNLEVDVMEGDEFVVISGSVYQERGTLWRSVNFGFVDDGWCETECDDDKTPLDLPTFTRYCEACDLTVKHVKPEPQVETIKPPEWGVVGSDGVVRLHKDHKSASRAFGRVVRIDWGAK